MKVLTNKRDGISLVALIVTIIVLIILTGAVIVTFMEGGIVDRAKDAVARNDLATLKEVYSLKYNKKKIDVDTGATEGIAELDALKEATDELKLKGFSYADGTVTYTGDNKYISEWLDSEFIYKSLTEGGYYFTKIDGKTYMTGLKVGTNWETAGDVLSKLGEGYSIYDNNGTQVENSSAKVTTGYVIKKGNTEYATVVVKGDLTSDFDISASDKFKIGNVLAGVETSPTKAQLLAGDINNDGKISLDDFKIIDLSAIGFDFNFEETQKSGIKQNIITVNDYVCTWYENASQLEPVLTRKGFNVEYEEGMYYTIQIASGTKFKDFGDELKEKLNVSSVAYYGYENNDYFDITDSNENITNGACIEAVLPSQIGPTEYCTFSSIGFDAILN